MEATDASETFVTICKITRRRIPEACNVNSHCIGTALDFYLGGASSNLNRVIGYPYWSFS
jgi:hypothetical protein